MTTIMAELKELIEMRNNGDITKEDYSQIKSILLGKNTSQDDEIGEEEKKQKEEEEKNQKEEEEKKHKKKLLELLEWLVKNKKEKNQKEEEEKKQKEITEWLDGASEQLDNIDQKCIYYDSDLRSMRELRDDEEFYQFSPREMRVLNPTQVLDWNKKIEEKKAVEKKEQDEWNEKKQKELDMIKEKNEKAKIFLENKKKELIEWRQTDEGKKEIQKEEEEIVRRSTKCIWLLPLSSELLSIDDIETPGYTVDGYKVEIDHEGSIRVGEFWSTMSQDTSGVWTRSYYTPGDRTDNLLAELKNTPNI